MPPNNNAANHDGWVESTDPNTGRKFYANHVTRVTQWDPPPGWNAAPAAAAAAPSNTTTTTNNGLPMGWEEMKDPQTGRSFYVDHANQITTWTKPTTNAAGSSSSSVVASAPVAASSASTLLQAATTTRSSSYHQHHTSAADDVSSYSSTPSQQQQQPRTRRTWSDASSSYFRPASSSTRSYNVDFSDAFSKLDFKVQKVEDALRPTCASCGCDFTMSKRRHHCRLCGDVYCNDCSPHKVELPLEGPEFAKPVRICNGCYPDVEQGNYFSPRRYLTPLTLYEPPDDERNLDEETGVATHETVNAALCALTSDLDALILNASTVALSLEADVLVPAIAKHLHLRATADRAVRCLASLLSLGAMASNMDYAKVFYRMCAAPYGWDDLLNLLERSGSDRRTLYTQEQATKAIFYLTEASLLKRLDRMQDALDTPLDIPRATRAMLDHASSDQNPNLQRWAASGIRHLVVEEERRLTTSANEIANLMAVSPNDAPPVYQSFLPELVSTGGILILCSLMGADDSDTRAHATAALGATLDATRAMDESLASLYEITGGFAGMPSPGSEVQIIRAIVQAGGCSQALSQLFQSAETHVARMGCDFCASLVMPLLEDARGTATLEEGYDPSRGGGKDNDDLGACREAALALASGPCLPSLLSMVRSDRPLALKQAAMESLAAIAMAVGEMTKANPPLTDEAVTLMLEEGMVPLMLYVLEEFDTQALSTHDTPSSRIREAAGIVISAMAVCSMDAMMELQSSQAISVMWSAMNDLTVLPSRLRGDGAPLCLGMLQTAAALLTYSQHDESVSPSERMDRLLEAVDAGAIPVLSKILFTKIDYGAQDKAVGAMKARDAACRMLTALFDIARASQHMDHGTCHGRLWDAVDADAYSRNPSRSIVTAALQVLHNAAKQGRLLLQGARRNKGPHFTAAVMDLVESSLYAVGSMCGSTVVPGLEQDFITTTSNDSSKEDATLRQRRRDASAVACDILTAVSNDQNMGEAAVLPTMLVGGFGEKTAMASLRLALAIGQNGNMAQHSKLASSGILVPLADNLQTAMNSGDTFRFSACLTLLTHVGPHVQQQQTGQLASVQAAIRTATSVLQVTSSEDVNTQTLKESCMSCLEALSSNASLWTAISKDALPSIVLYVQSQCSSSTTNTTTTSSSRTILGALKALTRIVAVPSHGVAAARAGLPEALGRVLVKYANVWDDEEATEPMSYYDDTTTTTDDAKDEDDETDPEEVPLMALDILYTLYKNNEVRRSCPFLDHAGVLEGLVCIVSKSATLTPKPDGDGRADVCLQALELLGSLFRETNNNNHTMMPLAKQLTTPRLVGFLEVTSREPAFVRALASTLLSSSKVLKKHPSGIVKLPHYNADSTTQADWDIPSSSNSSTSPPLLCVMEKCGPYPNTHMAALQLLYRLSVLVHSTEESEASDLIWSTFLTDDDEFAMTICAQFLLTMNELRPYSSKAEAEEFDTITSPLVRHILLETLQDKLDMESDYCKSVLVTMQIPSVCLSLWTNPHLQTLAFEFVSKMAHDEELAVLFVEQKSTLQSLFDMLGTTTATTTPTTTGEEDNADIRGVVAHILQSLAESGVLTAAVQKFGLKSAAIAGLAKACMQEGNETSGGGVDAVATSSTLSATCMECLVDLLSSNKSRSSSGNSKITEVDAQVIAKCLGSKICHMVLTRFLERAKLSSSYGGDDDLLLEDDICDAPYVVLLVAMAQHASALVMLQQKGGISALVMVAGEGHVPAMEALLKNASPQSVLEADGHGQLYKMIHNNENDNALLPLETRVAAMELLAHLSNNGNKKTMVNDDDCLETLTYALHCIGALDIKAEEEEEEIEEEESESDAEPELQEEEENVIEGEYHDESDEEEEEEPVPSAPVVVTRRKKKQEAVVAQEEIATTSASAPPMPADWMVPPPMPPPPMLAQEKMKKKKKEPTEAEKQQAKEKQETQLQYASLTLLSNLVPLCLDRLTDCSNLVPIVHELSKNEAFELPALSFLQSLAPFARLTTTSVTIDTDVLISVFLEALENNKKNKSNLASKLVATQGLAILILDATSSELQERVVKAVVALFQANVKKCAVQRSSSGKTTDNAENRTRLAQLTYELVMILRQVTAVQRTILTQTELLVSMVHLLEWRYDSRTASSFLDKNNKDEEQFLYWNGAVSQVLSHLSTILHIVPALSQQSLLRSTVLVMARPGKAPRKTSNLLTTLEGIISSSGRDSSSDASAVLAARHVLSVLTK